MSAEVLSSCCSPRIMDAVDVGLFCLMMVSAARPVLTWVPEVISSGWTEKSHRKPGTAACEHRGTLPSGFWKE